MQAQTLQRPKLHRTNMNVQYLILTIAAIIAIITVGQLLTQQAQLKHDLFDRRYKIYEHIMEVLAQVMTTDSITLDEAHKFAVSTRGTFWILGSTLILRTYQKRLIMGQEVCCFTAFSRH